MSGSSGTGVSVPKDILRQRNFTSMKKSHGKMSSSYLDDENCIESGSDKSSYEGSHTWSKSCTENPGSYQKSSVISVENKINSNTYSKTEVKYSERTLVPNFSSLLDVKPLILEPFRCAREDMDHFRDYSSTIASVTSNKVKRSNITDFLKQSKLGMYTGKRKIFKSQKVHKKFDERVHTQHCINSLNFETPTEISPLANHESSRSNIDYKSINELNIPVQATSGNTVGLLSSPLVPHREYNLTNKYSSAHPSHKRTENSELKSRASNSRDKFKVFEMDSTKHNTLCHECYISGKTKISPIVTGSIKGKKKVLGNVRLLAITFCAVISIGTLLAHAVHGNEGNEVAKKLSPNTSKKHNVKHRLMEHETDLTNGLHIHNQPIQLEVVDKETSIEHLREEYEEWVAHHKKEYHSEKEKEKRFQIWASNHLRTEEKNKQHGPCKMTKQPVFGSNHFKDLHHEEFKAQYLTGYTGPVTDKLPDRRTLRSDQRQVKKKSKAKVSDFVTSDGSHDPKTAMNRHPSVQERYLNHLEKTPTMEKKYIEHWDGSYYTRNKCSGYTKTYVKRNRSYNSASGCTGNSYRTSFEAKPTSASANCKWYDLSCWFRWLFSKGFGYVGGTREPAYNANNYPTAIDWRDMGAVTSVHSQGNCGACWAITAVETIESAYFIKTGNLLDLAETEVIACDDSCEMCDGGWPQNAYDYVKENNGLPLEKYLSYDDDFLYTLSMVTNGQSDALTDNEVNNYMAATCPSGGNSKSGSGSGSEDKNDDTYSGYDDSITRYGAVKGYAYATDRCYCYDDGSGCNCNEQNEILAVRNIASYGPATVCLEASTWQDYAGGILTAESGCSQDFLDMNHCVQAVGYAYFEIEEEVKEENSKSGSGSQDQEDNGQRQGYWIVRNQWSEYWGMNGYIYVSMGENTCGILNDMTQAFMD